MEMPVIKSTDPVAVKTGGAEQRGAQRYTLLIRAVKIVADQGEFIGVVRDVSSTGLSVRLFHKLPETGSFALELQSGESFAVETVWENDGEAGFQFAEDVSVERFINEVGEFPKRGLRLGICLPVTLMAKGQRHDAVIENISQQGARLSSESLFAIDQYLTLEGEGLRDVRAKVRWRGHGNYGVVFDDTFSLGEFAKLAAILQAPALLSS